MTGQQPIGWWVKRLDGLLEQVVDHALADDGLTRRHWQVLHALGPGGMDERDLGGTLAPFGGAAALAPVLTELTGRGWVTRGAGGRLEHTGAGRVAAERLLGRITALRRQVSDGVTAEEYERTVAALARMVGNVERVLGEPGTTPSGGS